MIYSTQLKRFCVENNFKFPEFRRNEFAFKTTVYWYNKLICESVNLREEDSIINCILQINEFLKSEKNYIILNKVASEETIEAAAKAIDKSEMQF